MALRGRRNEEILPEEVLETENVLNSELSFASNALNYRKYKKSKILWTHTQSYASSRSSLTPLCEQNTLH